MSKLYLVGIGPGSSDYLTKAAIECANSVDVLVGSQRALDLFPGFAGETLVLRARNMDEMMKKSISLVDEGRNVAILSTGDPGFSGVLKPILKLQEDLDLEVIPGISSLQLAAARLQLPWDEINLLTLHGKGNSQVILDYVDNGKPTMVLPDFRVEKLAQFLIDEGTNPERKVSVCERLSYPDERIVTGNLREIAYMEFSYLCVMVVY
ncbi:MAG: precorrin-6y C5,15-methyltransferase (decarboxylating) subunit CbiE [Methanobacterium formicicum]|jgi:cobalt-precorrin-7 (C5)-methyltransferase|uniref:Precorrin-6Y C5,15-methyltransferase (Decarboxylating) CbiE n=1 Tax=Methanobacterium formicicum TaxID=2162 RepID=A0A089ZDQ5_METFO|nr:MULTISPECIES: precorrin-6y C5,15-methyltransferase (decarboxylating) subunit CbiE [Methanobacterium]AIS30940.1 precorrin-6Y C5,15-methyltransferase (decarboxylating) CbiE [Methanobacterium formicicum]MDD4809938.1 precorrin-6y C5,15-methyltransferase (decarboxylating) subunit CbiE [Methanobacterium formicicum]CEL23729.1 precorrin-6y C5,15-methyltransferase subunit CbiE [Methanobacterium formicicum]